MSGECMNIGLKRDVFYKTASIYDFGMIAGKVYLVTALISDNERS